MITLEKLTDWADWLERELGFQDGLEVIRIRKEYARHLIEALRLPQPPAGSQWPSLDARWIPVIERIPEPEVLVLAWDGGRTFVTWFGSLRDAGCGVTHWIPYPMPPGAKSDMHDGRRAVVTKEGDGYGHCPECRAVPGTCIHSADEKPAPVHLRDIDSGGCVSHCPACRASAETSVSYIPGAVCGRMDCARPVPVGNVFCTDHQ